MKFLIITHVLHKSQSNQYFAYAPYVNEMNVWLKYVDTVHIVAPLVSDSISQIDSAYHHEMISISKIPSIEFTSFKKIIRSLFKLPKICYTIFKACKTADHIHLRCPGNIGLLGCFIQILFPKKTKTAKYAGNWDPNAKQPWSYRLQKWILGHAFLTKNMQVLVYGNWEQQTKNIKPFFTASYYNSEKESAITRDYTGELRFVFTGSLVNGKRPLLAIQVVEALHDEGLKVRLDIYGDGILREELQQYVTKHNLEQVFFFHGNQSKETIKEAFKKAHFALLPSKSEGWPKAIAEAMFFGAIPISTRISCIPFMLDYGKRGILIDADLNTAVLQIKTAINNIETLELMSKHASNWSQNYTLDVFESEIYKLLN